MGAWTQMKPLGICATFGWALLAFMLAQAAGTAVVLIWFRELASASAMGGAMGGYDGTLVALATLITNPVQIVLLGAIARWRTGIGAADYLGFVRFPLRDFLIGFLAIAALVATSDGVSHLVGFDIVPPVQSAWFTTARANGWLLPLLLTIVIVGPVGEEALFRGFL